MSFWHLEFSFNKDKLKEIEKHADKDFFEYEPDLDKIEEMIFLAEEWIHKERLKQRKKDLQLDSNYI